MLPTRPLGSQGLVVSALGLGCMSMSGNLGAPEERDEQVSISVIHRALELGVTMFDTAEAYGPFTNEELLGKALAGRRDRAIIATKFGFKFDAAGVPLGVDSRPEHIKRVVEGSLRRLQTDYIDLLYQHRVDRSVPIEDTVGAMADLVRAGKVRYLGLSESGVETTRRAHAVHPISAVQSEYSLWERNLEAEVIPAFRKLGIGLVAFSPLGRGFLTGTARRGEEYSEGDFRRKLPRFQGDNFDRNMQAAQGVRDFAARKGITPGQVALAWLLAKGPDIVPIPGTKRIKYLEENLGAASVVLSAAETSALDAMLPPETWAGERYLPSMQAMIDR